jgi:hypothetical protein
LNLLLCECLLFFFHSLCFDARLCQDFRPLLIAVKYPMLKVEVEDIYGSRCSDYLLLFAVIPIHAFFFEVAIAVSILPRSMPLSRLKNFTALSCCLEYVWLMLSFAHCHSFGRCPSFVSRNVIRYRMIHKYMHQPRILSSGLRFHRRLF